MLSTDLDWFVELARTRHMGDTAAKLGIPQPTLSRRLSRLEEALGTRLFDRGGRHLELNARGRVYADAAATATESLRTGAADVARLKFKLSQTKNKRKNAYTRLGELSYTKYRPRTTDVTEDIENAIAAVVAEITDLTHEIVELELRIKLLKAGA